MGVTITLKKLSYGEQKEMMKLSDSNPVAMLDIVLMKSIIGWDLKDGDKVLPITIETLDLCEAEFINTLSKEVLEINNISMEQEKNLPGLSEQA